MTQHGLTEDLYATVGDYRDHPDLTARERVAIEYAERFALDHLGLDDAGFWTRFRAEWADEEILDLSVCIASFLGLGRLTQVLGAEHSCRPEV